MAKIKSTTPRKPRKPRAKTIKVEPVLQLTEPDYMEQIEKIKAFTDTELNSLLKKDYPIIFQMSKNKYRINGSFMTVLPDCVLVENQLANLEERFNYKKLAFFFILARNKCKMVEAAQIRLLDIKLLAAANDSILFTHRFKQFLAKGDSFKCQFYITRLQESKYLLNTLLEKAMKYAQIAKYRKGPNL